MQDETKAGSELSAKVRPRTTDKLKEKNMNGWELILAERQRQIKKELFTADHDLQHYPEDLKRAAECYVIAEGPEAVIQPGWPWGAEWWKPKDRQRNLIRAGALYLAASDRATTMGKHVQAKELRDSALLCAHAINRAV